MAKAQSQSGVEMAVPQVIVDLVERFERNREAYRAGKYNETQVRLEFINPMFKALGWDIDNDQGYAEAYKDVIHEDAIRIDDAVKAPDYCFRIGGTRKFFLEAKKPSVNIKGDPTPAYQLRRYAWSGKLPLSILTDFEEFAVYDCRVKPDKSDKSSTARIGYYTFDQYTDPKVWHAIASIFARDAILKGSFDKYAQSTRRKRGTAEVDDAFLAEIESWRTELARNIALRNEAITTRQLNTAVQLTVDRIIFLRICEDRGIEDYGRLQALRNGDRVYQRLFELFEKADQRYNSGLFYFKRETGRGEPDSLTPGLNIDDKVLKGIIKGLYYPESPYEFSVLPADILGHVYEQFLGKVIRLTKGHRAEIEEKPEVRKAGGVYYTPTYIVEYIVKQTVGKLLEGASVKWIGTEKGKAIDQPRLSRTLRVLDPACGSGSFLIGAYQHLLDWHLNWYMNDEPEKWAKRKRPPIAANQKGEYRLTTPERKRILLQHIYGVDIDAQAVEVTKLSLLLKVLEGETAHSLGTHLWYDKERALPDLSGNIKCGNSLIGPDFYDNQQQMMFDEEERYRINAFDWKAEFPEVFAGGTDEGGFDAVIGNPPYLAGREWDDRLWTQREYFSSHYRSFTDQYDLYALFIERGIYLLHTAGLFGFITPNTWLNNEHFEALRSLLLRSTAVHRIGDFRNVRVFPATVLPIVIIAEERERPLADATVIIEVFSDSVRSHTFSTSPLLWCRYPGSVFNIDLRVDDIEIIQKIESAGVELNQLCEVRFGVKVYQKGKGKPPQCGTEAHTRVFDGDTRSEERALPYLWGEHISRYSVSTKHRWINYGAHLAEPRDLRLFQGPRVLMRRIVGPRLVVTPVWDTYIVDQLIHTITPRNSAIDVRYIAGVLGSRAISFYLRKRFNRTERTFPEIRVAEARVLPVAHGSPEVRAQVENAVQHLIEANTRLAATKTTHERAIIQRDIDATDRQIDRLVYDLYGLTEEEIAIVEEATK